MSTTVNVICYKSKLLKNNEHPLMLRICKNRKLKYISLGISIHPTYWDFRQNKPKSSYPDKERLETLIADKIKVFNSQILEFKTTDKEFTVSTLVQAIDKPTKARTVKEVFEQYINQLLSANRVRYAETYEYVYQSLIHFNGHLDIYFSDIDVPWLKKYQLYLRNKDLSLNSIGIHFRTLRVLYNFAIEEKVVKADYYPFKEFKVSKLREATAKRSITKKEVLSVINYKGHSKYECLAIDIFTFSYLSAGINLTDIARVTSDNVIENKLVYKRKKTNKLINIPLHPKALEIIEKYHKKNSAYLFPILSATHKTEQQKIYRIRKVTRKINKCLKEIGKELNIPIKLTTYVSRHSFATNLKRSGVSTSIICECLGHSSEKVTQIYLDSFENSQIDEAMKNLL